MNTDYFGYGGIPQGPAANREAHPCKTLAFKKNKGDCGNRGERDADGNSKLEDAVLKGSARGNTDPE